MWRSRRSEAPDKDSKSSRRKWWSSRIFRISAGERERIISIIKGSPGFFQMGPAWDHSIIPSLDEKLLWYNHKPDGNLVLSSSPSLDNIYLELDYRSNVVPLDSTKFLAFYDQALSPDRMTTRFMLFDVTRLKEFKYVREKGPPLAKKVKKTRYRISPESEVVCVFDISLTEEPGVHEFDFPQPMKKYEDILALGEVSLHGLVIYIMKPRRGELHISPQKWWNNGDWDKGYQGITRIVRDPVTDNIVGEGLRMGVFLLNPNATRFLGWVVHWSEYDMDMRDFYLRFRPK